MIGETLSHYRILEKLGEGGMGEVFIAEDLRLKRRVALKVLQPDLAGNPDRVHRFQREAEAVAALNHPNIVTIYSVERFDGGRFLTMELLDGDGLDTRIPKGGLPLATLFSYAIPLADALAAAHHSGVVHRDLKPGNILVTHDGRIKVLDFGLAKLIPVESPRPGSAEDPTAAMTRDGAVLGTVPYMSPEQVEGKAVDHRSDLFSLGVVLYEMATGRRPFDGESSASLMSSILRDSPPAATEIRGGLPRVLDELIHRCLAKDPDQRFQSAGDLRDRLVAIRNTLELTADAPTLMDHPAASDARTVTQVDDVLDRRRPRRWRGLAAAAAIAAGGVAVWFGLGGVDHRPTGDPPASVAAASVAVLPFSDLSQEGNREYLADGLTEEIINALARVPDLKVAARTSSFSFKGETPQIVDVAASLHVENILEGSVRTAGDRLRISAQLVNAADGYPLWSDSYDLESGDVFAVQDSIARSVVAALEVTLLSGETSMLSQESGVEAYNHYLMGRFLFGQANRQNLDRAVASFQEALALDPGFAPAWAGLAGVYIMQASRGYRPVDEAIGQARVAVERALFHDENLAEALSRRGRIKQIYDHDWWGGYEDSQRALTLAPGDVAVIRTAATIAFNLGRLDEAVELGRRAAELDPLRASVFLNLGLYHFYADETLEAETAIQRVFEVNPGYPVAHNLLGRVYLVDNQLDAARREMEQEPDVFWRTYGLALVYQALGRHAEADAALAEMLEKYGSDSAFQIAEIFAFRGDLEMSFRWLDRAFEQQDPGLTELLNDPLLENLDGDPRYAAFVQRLGLR